MKFLSFKFIETKMWELFVRKVLNIVYGMLRKWQKNQNMKTSNGNTKIKLFFNEILHEIKLGHVVLKIQKNTLKLKSFNLHQIST
jgi:hypothetical protein